MIIDVGWCRVGLETDDTAFARLDGPAMTLELEAQHATGAPPRRMMVEVYRRIAGLPQRALLGAQFTPGHSASVLTVVVASSASHGPNVPLLPGPLGHPLVPSLPAEFVPGVIRGLTSSAAGTGELRVDRAGNDPVESSPLAFQFAAELLAVLLTDIPGPVTESSVGSALNTLRETNHARRRSSGLA